MKNDDELSKVLDSAQEKVVVEGLYQHYKGNIYKVLEIALIESSLEPAVVYQAQYGEKLKFIRPLRDWLDSVEHQGESVPRFVITK